MSIDRLSRHTFDALPPHIAVLDATGDILLTNRAWRDFADANGGSASRVSEGANYLQACDRACGPWSEGSARMAAAIRDVAAGRRSVFSLEYPCHSPREHRWFRANVSRFTSAGDVRVAVVHENVTERVAVQTQLEQVRSLDTLGGLTGGIVHDFNNLISIVATSAELARLELPPGHRATHEIAVIRAATSRAATLSQQLLAVSRRQPVERAVVDLDDVIARLLPLLRRLVPETVDVHAGYGSGGCRVNGDRGQIEQVLLNLAANAGAAMPDGGLLAIHTEQVWRAGNDTSPHGACYVRLVVHDTGTGMDPETRRRIFDPFFTTKAPGVGTGLGLATVYGIVTRHGGDITCTSEPGRGTTFVIDLPAAGVSPEANVVS